MGGGGVCGEKGAGTYQTKPIWVCRGENKRRLMRRKSIVPFTAPSLAAVLVCIIMPCQWPHLYTANAWTTTLATSRHQQAALVGRSSKCVMCSSGQCQAGESASDKAAEAAELNRQLAQRQGGMCDASDVKDRFKQRFEDIHVASEVEPEKTLSKREGWTIYGLTDGLYMDAVELWQLLPDNLKSTWRFSRVLGKGSFGVVVLAEKREPSVEIRNEARLVAVKLVPLRQGEEPIALREGLVLSLLDSERIPKCLDFGISPDGVVFTVMEYFDGIPLDQGR